MFKYNDKVIVIKDEENDGFYIGMEGIVKGRTKLELENGYEYILSVSGEPNYFYWKEDEIELKRVMYKGKPYLQLTPEEKEECDFDLSRYGVVDGIQKI